MFISAATRRSMRSGLSRQLKRSGDHHEVYSPNGQNLPFDTQKNSFKYTYTAFCVLPVALTAIAYWFQVDRKADKS
ncbi:hypothetical protein AYI70_g7490 [Smittium culicis]|uniref:Uncharacterized protein n=1 Tax=Smittium culicis TaxID=133412 RepID=A0A1R1XKF0_9FUNG|nr:hypothetical protein AYI70_g9009 [Smittium culicis]OMJ15090.1 hypothetical protein AYI70_g7490 [Smittium culicis]